MGISSCNLCKIEKSEEHIIKFFYEGSLIKHIDYNTILKRLNLLKTPIKSFENISYNDYKDLLNKFIEEKNKEDKIIEKSETIIFNKTILQEVHKFIDSNNKNNFQVLLLILFPLFSRTIENKNMKIMEFFTHLKYSTITTDINFKKIANKNSNDFDESKFILDQWKNDKMKIEYKILESNLSFYISTIIVGYSLAINKYFQESNNEILHEEMKDINRKYYNGNFLRLFFLNIIGKFSQDMKIEAKKYDLNLENFYIDFANFKNLIEENIYLLDFKETRQEFYQFSEKEYIKISNKI